MLRIDLNCDLGESFGAYTIGMDNEVLPLISSANVACGYHAGDALVMEKTVRLCKQYGVAVGAHVGFPDLIGFGRRDLAASPSEVKAYTQYQIGALDAFCKAYEISMHHVKPHGALYNMAAKDASLAQAICEAIMTVNPNLTLLSLSGSEMMNMAKRMGLSAASEVFADRGYMPDGTLVPRSQQGAIITDHDFAADRVARMITSGSVTAIDGSEVALRAESVCVHGDGAQALDLIKRIREVLAENSVAVIPF